MYCIIIVIGADVTLQLMQNLRVQTLQHRTECNLFIVNIRVHYYIDKRVVGDLWENGADLFRRRNISRFNTAGSRGETQRPGDNKGGVSFEL